MFAVPPSGGRGAGPTRYRGYLSQGDHQKEPLSDVETAPTADGPLPERTLTQPGLSDGAPPFATTPCCEDERASTTARVAV